MLFKFDIATLQQIAINNNKCLVINDKNIYMSRDRNIQLDHTNYADGVKLPMTYSGNENLRISCTGEVYQLLEINKQNIII